MMRQHLYLLLARGRDRLETGWFATLANTSICVLLLARGRDRLETLNFRTKKPLCDISYSLGDAIDWKLLRGSLRWHIGHISYSLGDAIDWKHGAQIVLVPHMESPTR